MSQEPDQLFVDGWLSGISAWPSSNCDARPKNSVVDLLVIHNISLPLGQFSSPEFLQQHLQPSQSSNQSSQLYIADLFLNRLDTSAHPSFSDLKDLRVSAHFLILRHGQIIQFVSCDQRAWHAGVSDWLGRSACNNFSIGVEVEGSDFVPFTSAQYDSLTWITHVLSQHYPIKHIVGHQDIAPDRKTDPGPFFDWPTYQKLLRQRFPLVLANARLRD